MSTIQRPLISFDWAIKKILRQKPNFVVLEGFLSVLLNQELTIKNILESESNAIDYDDKINKVDILCTSKNEEVILIELQYNSESDYFHRMLYGASKIVTDFMQKGYAYKDVKKIYSINIVYFDLGQGEDYVYYGKNTFEGIHKHDLLQLSKTQKEIFNYDQIHQIFPEYFIIKVNKFNDVSTTTLDEWIYYFKNNKLPVNYSAKGLKEVEEILNYQNMDEQARIDYDAHQKAMAISANVIETASLEGEARGEARGQALEREKAQKEKESMILSAYNMGVDVSIIARFSNFSEEEVNDIIKKK